MEFSNILVIEWRNDSGAWYVSFVEALDLWSFLVEL